MRVCVYGFALLGLLGGLFHGLRHLHEQEEKDRSAMWRAVNAVRAYQAVFHGSDLDRNGLQDYWTADVAGLLAPFTAPQWDVDPRELAAADVAPLIPRAEGPRPFHGYFVLAVRFDPLEDAETDGEGSFAICFFPAAYAKGTRRQDTWFVTNYGRFKADTGGVPVRRWIPRDELRRKWGRCC